MLLCQENKGPKDRYFYGEPFMRRVYFSTEEINTHTQFKPSALCLFHCAVVLGYVRYTVRDFCVATLLLASRYKNIMKQKYLRCLWVTPCVWSVGLFASSSSVQAGVVATPGDAGTTVIFSGNRFDIEGGTQAGGNLFHKF